MKHYISLFTGWVLEELEEAYEDLVRPLLTVWNSPLDRSSHTGILERR